MTSSFTAEITALADEAGGVLDLQIILPTDLEPLIRAATAAEPDPDAVRRATALLTICKRVATAEPDDQQKCAAWCGRPLAEVVFSTVLVSAHVTSPVNGMVLAVCRDCAATRADVLVKAREALRRVCFPELRPITVHPSAGRA